MEEKNCRIAQNFEDNIVGCNNYNKENGCRACILYDRELTNIPVEENNEPLINLAELCSNIEIDLDKDTLEYFGKNILLLRESVAYKLVKVQKKLDAQGMILVISDGYRPPELQKAVYDDFYKMTEKGHPEWDKAQIQKEVEIFVAPVGDGIIPPHTTGGAVDIYAIKKNGISIDMGCTYDNLTEKAFTDCPDISEDARKNRQLLRTLMHEQGFRNYPGEWWHYSYGDRIWALCTGNKHSIYNIVPFENVKHFFTDA